MCVWLGWTNGRFTLYSYITPVLPQEMQISYITFPEMVIHLVAHFGPYFHHSVLTVVGSAPNIIWFYEWHAVLWPWHQFCLSVCVSPEHSVHRWEAPFRRQYNFLRKHLSICGAFTVLLHPCSSTFTRSLSAQVLLRQKMLMCMSEMYSAITQKRRRHPCACRHTVLCLHVCLLSCTYMCPAIAGLFDFKVLSQFPLYNMQPVTHFTVTYNFPCAPWPHKYSPIRCWKRSKLDSVWDAFLTEALLKCKGL